MRSVTVQYVFAGLSVSDRDRAAAWYERLLGRPPTFLPNAVEAVWQLAATASLYVVADPERAGRGIATLAVDDLHAVLAEIGARGLTPGPVEDIAGAGRRSVLHDPDGNAVALVEILAGSRSAGPHTEQA